ncbi:MAG: hypothetical protein BA870_09290 [Desulfuromonadales bacterium C00003094]|jgi:predicted short-subunit dehydrogenase-like oxidoreductase (DUF2520 family)|nr:MAG: hypothetical protein BA870_09290 [Desulfuromonadales bacterium C00003094]
MRSLSIIGCGNVGKTLGRLWSQEKVFSIGDILNRSEESGSAAVRFIGAGRAVVGIAEMSPAEVFLISTPDEYIVESCSALAASGLLRTGDLVFHCSGALPSIDLISAKGAGACIGSVHPVKSFANPAVSAETFSGTFCGMEGDDQALGILRPAFEAVGGKIFAINPQFKTIYHAAAVMTCNYLTSLVEIGAQAYLKAGLDRETSMQVMEPIVRGTVENIFNSGTVGALTGPIARGDHSTVSKQLAALSDWNPRLGNLYRDLGATALELSRLQGTAPPDSLAALAKLLEQRD